MSYQHFCLQCGVEFQPKRSDAKFCSQNHRKQYNRRAENIRREVENVRRCLRFMELHAGQDAAMQRVLIESLDMVFDEISVTRARVTDKST